MKVAVIVELCFLLSLYAAATDAAPRIYFEKCNFKGFSCSTLDGRYQNQSITFACNSLTGYDVDFYVWQFRAPSNIVSLSIQNCSKLRLSLQCTSEGRNIQKLTISNITQLSITHHQGLSHLPNEVIFSDIGEIESIPSRAFLQIKKFSYRYGCAVPKMDLESITFRNVKVREFQRESFFNLTEMKYVSFYNVSTVIMHATALQIFMDRDSTFEVTHSKIARMDYLSFYVRGSSFTLASNEIKELQPGALNVTVNTLDVRNNTFGTLHFSALAVLAKTVRFVDNTFGYLATGALQAVGPGLPENALQGFGQLKFLYEFSSNVIESLEVASLHADWLAYKNVGGTVTFKYNYLHCTCSELAWLGTRSGFGKEFSNLVEFHEAVLDEQNKNYCLDAKCQLPIEVVKKMEFINGRCVHNTTLDELCDIYFPTTTITTTTAKHIALPTRTLLFNRPKSMKQTSYRKSSAPPTTVDSFLLCCCIFVLLSYFTPFSL